MQTASIKQVLGGEIAVGTEVTVQGWVRTRRDSKAGFSFIHLNDGSTQGNLQLVADKALPNYDEEIRHLTSGCSLSCRGTVVESRGRGQSVEIQAAEIEVVGWVEDPDTYPVQPKKHSFEFLRTVAHLRPRTNTFGAVTRVRHAAMHAIHEFFDSRGYYWINTPIVTSSDAEGAGQLFRVSTLDLMNLPKGDDGKVDFREDFFGREAFLTVSGQLNVEAYCLAMSKVYTFGPTFRAENSNTARHLAEFWMVEPEMAFTDLTGDADLAEEFLKHVFSAALERNPEDMELFNKWVDKTTIETLENIVESDFVRLSYTDAIDKLRQADRKWEFVPEWGCDLQTEHERYLTEERFKRPVIVTDYPKQIKAFYMRLNDDDKTVAAMDVLVPKIGEIIGGSQREERLDVLEERMRRCDLDPQHYWWYLDLRRYGSVPHAGFGLGLERCVQFVTGMANIRDVIPYPRTPRNVDF